MFRFFLFAIVSFVSIAVQGQTETIDNQKIIEMSRAGLSTEIISKKIGSARPSFDTTATGLIELKRAGVDDAVISLMMERSETALPVPPDTTPITAPATKASPVVTGSGSMLTRSTVLTTAKTIAFGKSSLQPSRQALEKELLKRRDFRDLNLTILRYKEQADLFVDIGYVSGSWLTHRYVYRIYDRRSGAVVAAGETTSWGSLAENLARHISKRLSAARSGRTS